MVWFSVLPGHTEKRFNEGILNTKKVEVQTVRSDFDLCSIIFPFYGIYDLPFTCCNGAQTAGFVPRLCCSAAMRPYAGGPLLMRFCLGIPHDLRSPGHACRFCLDQSGDSLHLKPNTREIVVMIVMMAETGVDRLISSMGKARLFVRKK